MDDLLREAIADAKAVRETALENAKIALEEAFTPRLQSMLSKKIATEMEDSEIEDDHEMEDDHDMEDGHEMGHEESEMEDDHDVEDGEERNEEEEMEDEDDLDLNSVLAELEADLNEEDEEEDKVDESEKSDKDEEDKVDESEKSDKDEEDKVDENDVSSDIGKADNKVNPEANDSTKSGAQGPEGEGSDKESGKELGDHEVVDDLVESEDLDLDEVLKALTEEEDAEDEADKVEELQAELKETREVVQFMRDKLNEVNLLNAKLLFSNKLFRAYGLNNDQKLKVVETFDRTKNLREVKLVYATLAESFKKPSKPLSESVSKGSSSKPVASTKPAKQEVLSEGAEMKARFKKLANIL